MRTFLFGSLVILVSTNFNLRAEDLPILQFPSLDVPLTLLPANLQNVAQATVLDASAVTAPLIQPVVFTVLYQADGTGYVPYTSLVEQIDQLNRAFSGEEAKTRRYAHPTDTGIRFTLHAVQYVQNDDWFNTCTLPSTVAVMRPQLAVNPAQYYNVYVCWVQNSIGLSWLPYTPWFTTGVPAESSWVLGSSIDWHVLPGMGGKLPAFKNGLWNTGNILTHETGHHFGLMHPYQDDCYANLPSDGIADTPRMTGNPIGACKTYARRDSCPKLPGKDDMTNYMVATNDGCRSHFTPGQVAFMQSTIDQYKPTLKKQLPEECVSAVDSTDQSPDLLPCVGSPTTAPLPGATLPSTRAWCRTSKTDVNQWGWACCDSSCKQGTPKF